MKIKRTSDTDITPASAVSAVNAVNAVSAVSARAFTLVELLAVIAIIGVLAAIIIPVTVLVRNKARQAQCASNLRQIGAAVHLYLGDNKGYFPDDYGQYSSLGGEHGTWWKTPSQANRALAPYVKPADGLFRCPSDKGMSATAATPFWKESGTSYAVADCNECGVMRRAATETRGAIPGTYTGLENPSRTILAFDNAANPYYYRDGASTWWHGDVANILLCDGHLVTFRRELLMTWTDFNFSGGKATPRSVGYTYGWSSARGNALQWW
jgi:prepilin-type N-terminal cleavage/methylation domain-containing protein/prepilin-type processing-associated H-X9-DG protein